MSRADRYHFSWPTPPWSIVQREISSTKLHKPLLTRSVSHSTFSIHGTNLYLRFSCVFIFLEIMKHNMPKVCLYFSISSIKTATQKFISFDKFFKCKLIGQLLQYNVTKLFQRKLETTKRY